MLIFIVILIIVIAIVVAAVFHDDIMDAFEDFIDEFFEDTDFCITFKQFKQYYQVDPEKWTLYDYCVSYRDEYLIGFSILDRIQYHIAIKNLEQKNTHIAFLKELEIDLPKYAEQIYKKVQNELGKLQNSIPPNDRDTQENKGQTSPKEEKVE